MTPVADPAVDHAVFGWDDLDEVTAALDDLGLSPDYGGAHGDGTTHMSLLGFDDGSYLEFVAPTDADGRPVRWPEELTGAAGPCSWALPADDVARDLSRLLDRGATVEGPTRESRERPDGTLLEWAIGRYAVEAVDGLPDGPTSADLLPFRIEDLTPRRRRVSPTGSVAGGPLTSVEHVVLAVESLEGAAALFRRLHRYPTPRTATVRTLGARVAWFPGRPAMLAAPTDDGGRVAERLAAFGPGPCAFLFGTGSFDAAADDVALTAEAELAGRRLAWLDADPFDRRIGVVAPDDA